MEVRIGFSPCPNDTFMFCGLLNGWVETHGISFIPIMKDVQELNNLALERELPVTKLSYYAYCYLQEDYLLLDSGSALGRGVGPLLITANDADLEGHKLLSTLRKVAVPGKNTTANFLFDYYKKGDNMVKDYMVFSDIEEAVLNGFADCGVIIHENRFTYEEKGLRKIVDLGEYWESKTKLPIPLGGIVSKKELGQEFSDLISDILLNSILFARNNPELVMPFVRKHSQEMDEVVMQKHINLYVNEFSLSLGNEGRRAIELMKSVVTGQLTGL